MNTEEKTQEVSQDLERIFGVVPSVTKNGDMRVHVKEIDNDQFFDLGNVNGQKHLKRSGAGMSITIHISKN